MLQSTALRALACDSVYEAGKVLEFAEVERRIVERREAVRVLGLGVPHYVAIRETPETRVERGSEGR